MDENYEEHVLALQPRERIYLYSDRISEAMNEKGEMFSMDGLTRFRRAREW